MTLMVPTVTFAVTQNLEDQVKALDLTNQAPKLVTREKLYSVQDRYLELKHKSEVTVGVAQNFTPDSFVQTQQLELAYRYHLSNRWALGLAYASVSNQLSDAGNRLLNVDGALPDIAYAQSRTDLTAEYNLFYGKFRLSMNQVLYFDNYVALGAGSMNLNTGSETAAVGDIGMAFWIGKWGSARIGVKDYYYDEPHISGTQASHNVHGHVDVGYLF